MKTNISHLDNKLQLNRNDVTTIVTGFIDQTSEILKKQLTNIDIDTIVTYIFHSDLVNYLPYFDPDALTRETINSSHVSLVLNSIQHNPEVWLNKISSISKDYDQYKRIP